MRTNADNVIQSRLFMEQLSFLRRYLSVAMLSCLATILLAEIRPVAGQQIQCEAESATLVGAYASATHKGYTGSGYADYVNYNDDYIEWTAIVPTSGMYTLEFRYALGVSTNRPLQITVGDTIVNPSLAFNPTGGWELWGTISTTAFLTSGTNLIRATATGWSGPNIDNLTLTPLNDGWRPLFNGQDLNGWYSWLPSSGRNNDATGVFKVHDGMIHILDLPVTDQNQEFGYIATNEQFGNYRLRLQYKWGEKRFPPRIYAKRDSGLLYHVVGPDAIWPRSVECQIQEGDTGDFWLLGNTGITTTVESTMVTPKKYQVGGIRYSQSNGRIVKSSTHDSLTDWNTVEVFVSGNESAHLVNDVVVNRGSKLREPDPTNPLVRIPLNQGRISIQAEGAEVYYRNIEIKPLVYTAPPPGAIVLFDGTDTSQWKPKGGTGLIQWPIVEGALQVCTTCGDIQSIQQFQDFKLHVEFRVPAVVTTIEQDRGNSGVFLQGRYEVQILDSFGSELSGMNDGGAIYGIRDADSNASLPAEIWQTYDIIFRAARWSAGVKIENARATVFWNGVAVHNNVELQNTFTGDPESSAPGSIVLQDHNNRVRYRNIWIVPLTDSQATNN